MIEKKLSDYQSTADPSPTETHRCDECGRSFDSKRGLGVHKATHDDSPKIKQYTCAECGDSFEDYPSRRETRGRENFFCGDDCKDAFARGDGIYTSCAQCGNDGLYIPPSRIDSMGDYPIRNHFCGKDCEGEWKAANWVGENHPSHKEKVDLYCSECGDTYPVKPSLADLSKYCSRECMSKSQEVDEIELVCPRCGGDFSKMPFNIKTETTFCSSECFSAHLSDIRSGDQNPAWKGGRESYYGPNWSQQRQMALARDDHICQLCSMSASGHYDLYGCDLNVHHITRFKAFDSYREANDLSNLVTVCHLCHKTLEQENEATQHELIAAAAV